MTAIGLDIKFSTCSMVWDNAEVHMQEPAWLESKNVDKFEQEMFLIHDPDTTDAEHIQRILERRWHANVNRLAQGRN